MNKAQLIEKVTNQIKLDVESKDVSAIVELLSFVSTEYLFNYLPEEEYKHLNA